MECNTLGTPQLIWVVSHPHNKVVVSLAANLFGCIQNGQPREPSVGRGAQDTDHAFGVVAQEETSL